jgi:hypothetical protein
MAVVRFVGLTTLVIAVASCAHAPATPAPAASPAPANGAPQTVAVRRIPPSRDSLMKLRAPFVQQVLASIAGRENQPAEQVFKNVQVLKGITAAQLVEKMDKEYSVAMSWNCTNCHRLAPQGNFASDTSNDKRRARFMQQMTNEINTAQLPKLYPKDTPQVSCATCHRGYNEPAPAEYLLPERGKPGGMPLPQPRGTPPPATALTRPPAP